jgi:riboflavin synthase
MFTGLIEAVGCVSALKSNGSGCELRVQTALAQELRAGDSIAVNGVCLTATPVNGGEMLADIGPETARVTTLGSFRRDQRVNLERSMRVDARFGGHFVQGHVDGTGTVEGLREEGDAHWITISFPGELAPFLIPKGSIAVDGVSLTVARLGGAEFDVMIVPFTWAHTNLASLRVGERVNLECDMIGKYVARAAELFGRSVRL